MSDLIKQLRDTQWYVQDGQLSDMVRGYNDACQEAADRIEALEDALREISQCCKSHKNIRFPIEKIAHRALEEKK